MAFNITEMQIALSQLTTEEFLTITKPLAIFVLGVTVYSIFVFKFHRFISKRDMFELNLYKSKEKFLKVFFYILEYLILFPVCIFLWFAILSIILIIISETYTANNIIIASMAIVATIRITAFYNEELSRDLAKLLPLAFLVIILVGWTSLSIPTILDTIYQIAGMWSILVYYLGFVLGLEIVLRILTALKNWLYPPESESHDMKTIVEK